MVLQILKNADRLFSWLKIRSWVFTGIACFTVSSTPAQHIDDDPAGQIRSRIHAARSGKVRLDLLYQLYNIYSKKSGGKGSEFRAVLATVTQIKKLSDSLDIKAADKRLNQALFRLEDLTGDLAFKGKTEVAESRLKEILSLYRALHIGRLQYLYYCLADVEKVRGDLSKALYYNIEAIRSMEKSRDTLQSDQFYYGIGCTLAELKQPDKALPYLMKAFNVLQQKRSPEAYHFVLLTLSVAMRCVEGPVSTLSFLKKAIAELPPKSLTSKQHDAVALAECYLLLRQYRNAERQFLTVIKLNEQRGNEKIYDDQRVSAYLDICKVYFLLGDYHKAEHYVKILLSMDRSGLGPSRKAQIHRTAFKSDSAAGNYLSAIKHFRLFKQLSDSLYNVNRNGQIAEMQVRFDTEQKNKMLLLKEKDIQLLKQQAQLQKSQDGRARSNRNWAVAVIVLMFGIGFYRYRLKQRTNLRLKVKQKEIIAKNKALEALLQENQWLMKEVHHRVKNNLQIVMSLLSSQSAYLKDEAALKAVMESQHRVQAMSLIHQKLYRSNNASDIYMPEYIGDLVNYLKESFKLKHTVVFDLNIEKLHMDVSRAVPIGLILNEVVTNALKYAFPFSSEDKLSIRLFQSGAGRMAMEVKDNGHGFPGDLIPEEQQSFGLVLIRGLTEDLEGTLKMTSNHGTAIRIDFNESYSRELVSA